MRENKTTVGNQLQYVDLHSHTHYSDGTSSPQTLVREMATSGVDVFAVTDHDTTAAYDECAKYASKWGLRIIPGVEISTDPYHILGLGVDVKNKQLQGLLKHVRGLQYDNTKAKVDALTAHGVPITWEKVIDYFPHEQQRLGSMNILYTMGFDAASKAYINEHYPNADLQQLVKTFVKGNGLVAKVRVHDDIEPKLAIDAIHAAGGKAILAHPFKEVKNLEYELGVLREKGIDGIEIQPNFGDANEPFIEYANRHNMLVTYGSDYHGGTFNRRPLLGKRAKNLLDVDTFLHTNTFDANVF